MKIKSLSLVLCIILPIPFLAFSWSDECVGVYDGDTISVMHEGQAEKIRLYGIDCPEKGQPFGKRAKQSTSDRVFGKIVEVKPTTTDRYGRTVAWVYADGLCLNKELLKIGLAWHYKQYSQDKELAELEEQASEQKVGLWSDPHAMPPWEWRRGEKGSWGKKRLENHCDDSIKRDRVAPVSGKIYFLFFISYLVLL